MRFIQNALRILFLILFILLTVKGNPMIWFAFFAVSLILALLFGRIYCGYVCPMNTAMVIMDKPFSKKRNPDKQIPNWLSNKLTPYIFLLITVVLVLITKKVLQISFPVMLIWIILAVVSLIVFEPYVFHNHICPFGVLQKLFSKSPIFSKYINTEKCILCMKCKNVCDSNAICINSNNELVISKNLCHQCQSCTLVCPVQAIKYVNHK